MKMRLQKIIADSGIASRRQAEKWITEGKVAVNGKMVREQGVLADPENDQITVKGKPLPPIQEKKYLILNKPPRCLTTMSDDRGRSTVMQYIKKMRVRVFPVGRLDFNTQGLLLFTNDGPLAKKLLDPKYQVTRTYQVKVRGIPEEKTMSKLQKGVRLDRKPTAPVEASISKLSGKNSFLTLKLVEGKNRHIKRICEKVGHPVIKIKRTHFASLNLTGLPLGAIRYLSPSEIKKLRTLVSGS